jgi:hypothetical protein
MRPSNKYILPPCLIKKTHIVHEWVNMGAAYETPLRKTLLKNSVKSGVTRSRVSCLGSPVFK